MNRRKFLALNTALAAGMLLPKAMFGQDAFDYDPKKKYYGQKTDLPSGEAYKFTAEFFEGLTENLSAFSEASKEIKLVVSYYPKGLSEGAPKFGTYLFEVTKVIGSIDSSMVMNTKFKKWSGEYKFTAAFFNENKVDITINELTSELKMEIKSKKTSLYLKRDVKQKEEEADDDYTGCYLTTACVQHKGLPDNCYELETLRTLRKDFMSPTTAGKKLLEEYKEFAPQLVARINSFDNSDEIYESMFNYLITPSIELIKENKLSEAVDWYKRFSLALNDAYLN